MDAQHYQSYAERAHLHKNVSVSEGKLTKKVVQPLKSSYFRAKIIPFLVYNSQCQFSGTQKEINNQTNQHEHKIRHHKRT